MAGILDSKTRVMDFFITSEGRRQAGTGRMRFRFATFTDRHTFYAVSGSKESHVAENATNRIFFEAYSRYQDTIVPELEAGQSMAPFRTKDFEFTGQSIATGSVAKGFQQGLKILTGSVIAEAGRALDGITTNYTDQRILGTHDIFDDTTEFEITPTTGSFSINIITKLRKAFLDPSTYSELESQGNVILEELPSLFADSRFSHFPNFKYMPPVNTVLPDMTTSPALGVYPLLNESPILSLEDLQNRLIDRPFIEASFPDTSRDNNLIGQFFQFTSAGVEKLSIIDFGEYADNDAISPGKRIYFIGKMYRDSNGAQNFLNIFTVVFD